MFHQNDSNSDVFLFIFIFVLILLFSTAKLHCLDDVSLELLAAFRRGDLTGKLPVPNFIARGERKAISLAAVIGFPHQRSLFMHNDSKMVPAQCS